MKKPSLISVKISNRQKVIFNGQVKAVSSENDKGPFDVLPLHANFISIIKNQITLHKLGKARQKIPIESAILKVWNNQVNIYLDIISPLNPQKQSI